MYRDEYRVCTEIFHKYYIVHFCWVHITVCTVSCMENVQCFVLRYIVMCIFVLGKIALCSTYRFYGQKFCSCFRGDLQNFCVSVDRYMDIESCAGTFVWN